MKHILIGAIAGAITAATPATGSVQATAAPAAFVPGKQVVDTSGKAVGIIKSVRGNEVILKTDRHEVRLPVGSFTPHKGKLVFGMSREALNQATDAMLAKAFLPGAEVHGRNGALAGRIEAIGEKFVTVELQSGDEIRLPRSSIAPGANGAVLGITVAELQQLVSQNQTD